MNFKKTITDILNLLPIVKNKKRNSAGVYFSETDTTFTGRTNKSDTFEPSTDPFSNSDEQITGEGKIIINKKI
jgi:hypothetical protein